MAAFLDGDELYDLADDPHETNNLINSPEHGEVLRELRTKLLEHMTANENLSLPSGKWGEAPADAAQLAHALKLKLAG